MIHQRQATVAREVITSARFTATGRPTAGARVNHPVAVGAEARVNHPVAVGAEARVNHPVAVGAEARVNHPVAVGAEANHQSAGVSVSHQRAATVAGEVAGEVAASARFTANRARVDSGCITALAGATMRCDKMMAEPV